MSQEKRKNAAELLMEKRNVIDSIRNRILENNQRDLVSQGLVYPTLIEPKRDESENNPFLGKWSVTEHTVSGDSFLEHFIRSKLEDNRCEAMSADMRYEFRDEIAVRRLEVTGKIWIGDEAADYRYLMRIVMRYRLKSDDYVLMKSDFGYLYQEIGTEKPSFRDYNGEEKWDELCYRWENGHLILEDVYRDDKKKLKKE